MKTPKELREWRARIAAGRTSYIVNEYDPVGYRGRPVHILTFGSMDAFNAFRDRERIEQERMQEWHRSVTERVVTAARNGASPGRLRLLVAKLTG